MSHSDLELIRHMVIETSFVVFTLLVDQKKMWSMTRYFVAL